VSVIISGKCCKCCGKEYYHSLGHPTWYDDVVKHGKPKNAAFRNYEQIVRSRTCLSCIIKMECKKEKGGN